MQRLFTSIKEAMAKLLVKDNAGMENIENISLKNVNIL